MTITPKLYYERPGLMLNEPQRFYLRKHHGIYPIRAPSVATARGYVNDWISVGYRTISTTPFTIMLEDGFRALVLSKMARLARESALGLPPSHVEDLSAADLGAAALGIARASMFRANRAQVHDEVVQNALAAMRDENQ